MTSSITCTPTELKVILELIRGRAVQIHSSNCSRDYKHQSGGTY